MLFSGKQALFFQVRDQPTLSTARFQIERLGQLLVDETEVTVEVEICAVDVGSWARSSRPSPSRARASRRPPSTTELDELKGSIYGVTASSLDAQLRDRLVEARLERHRAVGARVPGQVF